MRNPWRAIFGMAIALTLLVVLWSGMVQAAPFIVGIEAAADTATDIVTFDFATGVVVHFSPNAALGCSGSLNL